MNKKFSTLVATLLLSGALVSVNATNVKTLADFKADETTFAVTNIGDNVIDFLSDVALDEDTPYLLITQSNLTINGNGHTFTGRLVITGENVTVTNLTIVNSPKENKGSAYKNAISLAAASGTITNCIINCEVPEDADDNVLANGIVIFPTSADAKYNISGNIINNATKVASQWQSAALLITENVVISGLQGGTAVPDRVSALDKFDLSTVINNTYNNCACDYSYDSYGVDGETKAIRVTPISDGKGGYKNASYIKSLVENTNEDTKIVFNGTVEELLAAVEAIGANTSNANIAVQCDGGNVLYGNAENPNNGNLPVMADYAQLTAELGGYELSAGETSDYCMLILRSNANKEYYAISLDGNKTPQATQITGAGATKSISDFATSKAALWKMTRGQDHDGKYYYKFVNQNDDELEAGANAGTGADGAFFPVNNALYNNGVVFEVDGLDLDANNANYFGLYKAGNQVLSVEDLMWYENDGFSVTIYHDSKDDDCFSKEHLATNIAGNPFQMHLTPMKWDESTKKFVEFTTTTDSEEQFYLKDAEGNYIVAQKYASSGSTQNQSTYVFTTVTEKALEHDLATGEGNYFGLFQAEVSAKYTDLKTLTAIDVLKVYVAGSWAEIGRLDLGTAETPTLAASVSTDLKPILISLGSNKVVNPKTFLQKGKFYTVSKLQYFGKFLPIN